MHFCRTLSLIAGLAVVAACSREGSVACATDTRYSSARSAQPVQIPDDLSPPNENDAIRLPPDTGAVAALKAGECIDEPPPFSGDSRPFVTDEDSEESRQSRRQSRREAKREARAEAPAGQASDAPAEPREPAPAPAPAGDDRVIDN